jgi:hypothetical protein
MIWPSIFAVAFRPYTSDQQEPHQILQRQIGLDSGPLRPSSIILPRSSIGLLGGVFQNEYTSIHALHWQDHSFYTEGARRQEMFVIDKVLMRAG